MSGGSVHPAVSDALESTATGDGARAATVYHRRCVEVGSQPMIYTFVFGPVAVTVRDWVEQGPEPEGGARLEVRRTDVVTGPQHRAGAEGWRIAPVGEGGIWRSDILRVLDSGAPRYHHHPRFGDGDVGPRVFLDEMDAEPVEWTMRRIRELPELLRESGADDLADAVDPTEVAEALPAIHAAITSCLASIEGRIAVGDAP